ncbi:MAG: efflux RND transporter periplasmic adaptor subunit [Armatimonadetes bacterium]|nr:efflux RND transporter periplasmic adaptor subunit [Akkermansiaceae bacterium]
MKTLFTVLITALIVAASTWYFLKKDSPIAAERGKKELLYYQSAMHPWIKSDKPGRCTICGMELTPVYAGEKGFDASGGENIVALSQTQIQVLHVETAEAKVQPLVRNLEVSGMIDDDERNHRIISAYVDGRVETLFANHHGFDVVAGQPLAMIYSPSLLQAEREYRRLAGELKVSTGLRLKQMGLNESQIGELADKPNDMLSSMILAPLSGTVVEHEIYEGQYFTVGQKLFEIADFDVMWFQFDAYEQDLPWLEVGQKVDVSTPSQPGKIYPGVISFIDPNLDEMTRSTKVRVDLPNPKVNGRRELLHRVYADGMVKLDATPALSIPKAAVIHTGPQAVVYLDREEGAYAQVPVKLGRRGDALVEVLSGLEAGDRVVTNGNLLIDGQAEINRAFMSPTEEKEVATPSTGLNKQQLEVIAEFIETADAMAAKLAADDLPGFIQVSQPMMKRAGKLTEALKVTAVSKDDLAALNSSGHFHGHADIASARAAFLKFTMAGTAVLEPLRKSEGFPNMQIWECPMVDEAVPDSAKKGRWLQTGGRAGQNPFFGSRMLDCGKEIKP